MRAIKLFNIVTLLLLISAVTLLSGEQDPNCNPLLIPPLQNALRIISQFDDKIPGKTLPIAKHYNEYTVVRKIGKRTVGRVTYEIQDNTRLVINDAYTHPLYRATEDTPSRGVYKLLLAHIIKENPNIGSIEGQVFDDNSRVLAKTYAMSLRTHPELTEQERLVEALKTTPAFRARYALGFGSILELRRIKLVYFRVGRGP